LGVVAAVEEEFEEVLQFSGTVALKKSLGVACCLGVPF
jgi:hypothetical protein